MAITINQQPHSKGQPVGMDWIFTISSTNYSGNYKFKYIADLHIDNLGTSFSIRLKFSPNSTGNGIINISDILEQYVSSDNLGSTKSGIEAQFKGVDAAPGSEMPIHLIDKFSLSTKGVQRLTVKFGEEYSANATDAPTEYINVTSVADWIFWNGMTYNNEQSVDAGDYGINLQDIDNKLILNSSSSKLLTDAPTSKQLIRDDDYHTMAMLSGQLDASGFDGNNDLNKQATLHINSYDSSGTSLDTFSITINNANGGEDLSSGGTGAPAYKNIQYLGVGTANLKNYGSSLNTNWAYYDVVLFDGAGVPKAVSKTYRFYKQNNDCKGFETIRLTWLNKFGAWDYYNFTKKNIRSTNIKRAEYSKIKGNWNGDTFSKKGFNRGRGVLSTSATETISLNSDWFTSDDEAAWLEQLFISPEVYILGGYDSNDAGTNGAEYGNYLTPVVVTSKSYDRYTRANDKVAQYELDIEYSINKRIQRA